MTCSHPCPFNMRQQVRQTGVELTSGLTQLQQKFPSQISNARGAGSMQAIDARNAQHRDQLLLALKNIGKFSRFYFAKCNKVSDVIFSFVVFFFFRCKCWRKWRAHDAFAQYTRLWLETCWSFPWSVWRGSEANRVTTFLLYCWC